MKPINNAVSGCAVRRIWRKLSSFRSMSGWRQALFLAILLFGLTGPLAAQIVPPLTGLPEFGSFSPAAPFDTVNLSNLNVLFSIPVVNKAGLGMPFTFNLSYNSDLWYPQIIDGFTFWNSAGSYGWQVADNDPRYAYFGTFTFGWSQGTCPDGSGDTLYYNIYGPWTYVSPLGTQIPFFNVFVDDQAHVAPQCGEWGSSSATGWSSDGSAWYMTVNVNSVGEMSAVATSPDGRQYAPVDFGGPSVTDANGNQVTVGTQNGLPAFIDSLGVPELTYSGTTSMQYNYPNPSGQSSTVTVNYSPVTLQTNFGCPYISEVGPYPNQPLVSSIVLPDNSQYTFQYEPTPGYSGSLTGRISQITLPTGGTISYSYSGPYNGINCQDGTPQTLTRKLDPGNGGTSEIWTYSHSVASWYFSTTNVTDPSGNLTTMSFQQNYEMQRNIYQGTSTLLETVDTCYNGAPIPCAGTSTLVGYAPISRTVQTTLPGLAPSKVTTTYGYTSGPSGYFTDLPAEVDEYDYGPTLVRKTLTTYNFNTSCGITNTSVIDRPCTVTVQNASGGTVTSASNSYDGNGNLSSTTTGGLTRSYTHNGNGTVSTLIDVNNAQTTYNYGSGSCNGAFPTTITPPAGPTLSYTWDCNGGVMTSFNDTNGTTSYGYTDLFWRLTSLADANGNTTNVTYTPTTEETTLNFASDSTVDNLSCLDGLGRQIISQRKQAQNSTTYDSIEAAYDANGRLAAVSEPYSAPACSGGATAWNYTTYDPLNRTTRFNDAGGGWVAYSYPANDVLRTLGPAPSGENPKSAQYQYDALGRLQSVCEITGASGSGACAQNTSATGFFTYYTYDPLNNLTSVWQSGQSRSYNYDALSRLILETNPESGTTSYVYDTDSTCAPFSGDKVKRVDAVGNVSCYAYDLVHRLTGVTYPSGSYASVTPAKHFIYDSATVNGTAMAKAAGRLAEAYTCTPSSGSCNSIITDLGFSYWPRGEVEDELESTPNSGGYYSVGFSYWANGLINQMSGLGLPTFTYTPEGEGRVYSVAASTGMNPVSSTSYSPGYGLPTAVALGSGDSDAFGYDVMGRMKQYQFNVGSPVQSVTGDLTWNPNGTLNLLAITDPFLSSDQQTCSYAHDDLVRVASVNCLLNPSNTANWSQTFSFDPFGNLDKTGSNGGTSFLPTYNSATNQYSTLPAATPTYDSNGNLTADGFHNYTWDADGNRVSIDTTTLTFDALDRLVEENNNGSYTQYVYGLAGNELALMNGQTLLKTRIPLPGSGAAVYLPGSSGPTLVRYWHRDWRGSVVFVYNVSGSVFTDAAYAPYGEPTHPGQQPFAWLPSETYSDLGDALYREYSIPQGRWISPDPAGLAAVDPSNPQSWNRYAYVLNNPLANVDPDGLLSVVPSGCSPVSNNDPEGTSFVDCPPSSSDLDLFDGIFDGILSRLQTTNTVVSTINQGLQAFSNWFNQPRDPGCMAAATGIGASVGGVAGGALGALGGGAAGGTAGSLVPVVGTIGGGAAGAMSGAAAGAAEGALNGAAVGAGAGFIACAQGTGGGGGGGGNVRENKQARDARNQAERETGKKFSRSQERLFHDVDKTGMSYHDMVNLAKDILNGVINMP